MNMSRDLQRKAESIRALPIPQPGPGAQAHCIDLCLAGIIAGGSFASLSPPLEIIFGSC